MDAQLAEGLTFLAWTSSGFLIIVGVFIIKLLYDLSKLATSLNKSANIVQDEIEPIMKNLNESVDTINKFVQKTDKQVSVVTDTYDKVSKVIVNSVSKISAVSGFVLKEVLRGVLTGLKTVVTKKN